MTSTKLPITPPFSKRDLSSGTLQGFILSKKFMRYHRKCLKAVLRGNIDGFARTFAMICHSGRLAEFDESDLSRFAEEAMSQAVSDVQMRRAMDAILVGLSDKTFNDWGPVAEWAFVEFATDFARQYSTSFGFFETVAEKIESLEACALLRFVLLIKKSLGMAT